MTDLLLISDVPRFSTIFSRLAEDRTVRLRIATSLEKGGEELAAEKPGIVFVQTRLSGLSADILLMHLKKQLGRKRTRFVLLHSPTQAGEASLKLYQGHLDISQDDEALFEDITSLISSLLSKDKKNIAESAAAVKDISTISASEYEAYRSENQMDNPPAISPDHQEPGRPFTDNSPSQLSLADQGITYSAPRSRLSVYSEFNSSFDTAVSGMPPAEPLTQTASVQHGTWLRDEIEIIEPERRSKRYTFLLWMAPVVIVVVVVTMLQHRRSQAPVASIAPAPRTPAAAPAKPASPLPTQLSHTSVKTSVLTRVEVVPAVPTKPPAPPAQPVQPVKPATAPDKPIPGKTVVAAVDVKAKPNKRPVTLPDFIPRYRQDKAFGATNPGWERYKGQVTEFKVFREAGAIKAIQIVDRGGRGIPESFMKGVLKQLSDKPAFVKETSEKKDGYDIQRGHITENLTAVMYRDEQGGVLRACALTWQ